ncbi:MAG TPA: SUF system NifU family Fe-S cluster assembly protein [Candidatus Nanoarchaeia archaeon]|nr:SUF system NifU family Fe-S cluster assembly protein [Candidatus Nanoarchaeia archaeon]
MIDEMYQEIILDYYRNPRNKGVLPHPDIVSHDVNTSCGDEITMNVLVKDGRIGNLRFAGKGCAISQAAASMLTEYALGKSLSEVAKFNKEDVLKLISIPISCMRLKCALLGLKVLKLGVLQYVNNHLSEEQLVKLKSDQLNENDDY